MQENINAHFDQLVAVVDDVVRCLPDLSLHVQYLRNLGAMHCDVEVQPRLLELMGPVFCNTVRPLLLVQGRWSYQVIFKDQNTVHVLNMYPKIIKKYLLWMFFRWKWPGYFCSVTSQAS